MRAMGREKKKLRGLNLMRALTFRKQRKNIVGPLSKIVPF